MAVALVIVSHSSLLAEGLLALASQTVQQKVDIVAAGGTEDNSLGTSADKIQAGIQTVDNPDGTLILLDMGSATLATELALELLGKNRQGPLEISYAPLVEGTLNAALSASVGHTLSQVKEAAEQTAQAKPLCQFKNITYIEPVIKPTPARASSETQIGSLIERNIMLQNTNALHARPAALLVQTMAPFSTQITVSFQEKQASANSLLELLALNTRQGDTITLQAHGHDASEALDALVTLIEANFYENAISSIPQKSTRESLPATDQMIRETDQQANAIWKGISASPGIALAPAYPVTNNSTTSLTVGIQTQHITFNQIANEQQRLEKSLKLAKQDLQEFSNRIEQEMGSKEAAIFLAQATMLSDPALLRNAQTYINDQLFDVASALAMAGEEYAQTLQQLDNTLLAARATDVREAIARAIDYVKSDASPKNRLATLKEIKHKVVLLAEELTPSETARLQPSSIAAICTVKGGVHSHAAILARSLGIPALSGLPLEVLQRIQMDDEIGVDADQGILYWQPAAALHTTLAQHQQSQQQQLEQQQTALMTNNQQQPIIIADRRIQVLANVGNKAEAKAAYQRGAEGIGLLRTEFLFADATTFPDEETQHQRYIQLFQAFCGDRPPTQAGPITVRTLDAGADKPFPALTDLIGEQKEANPALGLRGIRIHLQQPQLLKQQYRALLLAAIDTGITLRIMLPMITTVEELQQARQLFTEAQQELQHSHSTQANLFQQIALGIMIEVPSTAFLLPELASYADFFSIGTNDLTQYMLACDRTNPTISSLYPAYQPAVLRSIYQIVQTIRQTGKPVAVCGEMAALPALTTFLVASGIDELSMSPASVPTIKNQLIKLRDTSRNAQNMHQQLANYVQKILQQPTNQQIEQLLTS